MDIANTSDRLLNEVERQKKYVDRLPSGFEFPLFNSKHALESQRRNGYRNTAAAAREIVDNAIEAGATTIHVVLERPKRLAAHQLKDAVSAVAFVDNGSGMIPAMARYALSWGASTHFDDPNFIGKFGFGLPNASINQTRHVEVFTKARGDSQVTKAWLDLDEFRDYGVQSVPAPVAAELPEFVVRYLTDNGLSFEHGTVVVWSSPDRLSYKKAGSLREHLVDDFGTTYRNMLERIELKVDGTLVEPVDPLFLDPRGRLYAPEDKGGAQCRYDRTLPVRYYRDTETGTRHLAKVVAAEDLTEAGTELIAQGAFRIRISRLPPGFAAATASGDEDAQKRFEIRKSRRGMSFVRAGREIETWDAFPRSKRDIASGLGRWPLLQGYAYHWGIEIAFDPVLDEVFGITNDKQTVRPVEDFWRLLSQEEVDRLLKAENSWQSNQRERPKPPPPTDEPSPAEAAAAAADSASGRKVRLPDHAKAGVRDRQEEQARRQAEQSGQPVVEVLKAIQEEAKRRPYRVEYVEIQYGPAWVPELGVGGQVVVKVNTWHRLFTSVVGPLLGSASTEIARQGVIVFLIALSKAELECEDDQVLLWYKRQRESVWSTFLGDALTVVAQTLGASPEDTRDTEPDPAEDEQPAASAARA